MSKILFAGSSDPKTAKRLARKAKIKFGKTLIKKFSCGETYLELGEEVKGNTVYIYQTSFEKPDEIIMETILMVNAAKEGKAKKVILISPYLLYARQDKKTSSKRIEPISSKVLARLYKASGVDKILTFHIHSRKALSFYNIEILNLKLFNSFAREIKKEIKEKSDFVVVAPDEGALENAQKLAEFLGVSNVCFFEKKREDPKKKTNKISSSRFFGNVRNKNVILADDMVDTGGTIVHIKEKLNDLGAKKVMLVFVHAVFSGEGRSRIENGGFCNIFFSNSIPLKTKFKNAKIIDIVPEISKYL